MPRVKASLLAALAVSVGLHLGLMGAPAFLALRPLPTPTPPVEIRLQAEPLPLPEPVELPPSRVTPRKNTPLAGTPLAVPVKASASLAAPPPPSAEEWKLASGYTLKNSKRYRNAWGQQVRSQMGTAVEGPDQGQVRFRITLHPDGRIAEVEELWSTSKKASDLAWQAIRNLPSLPPTPTGKPLVFEQTISFLPYETGWPPSYKNDCLPDPPSFQNPYAWNGKAVPPGPAGQQDGESENADEAANSGECDPTSTASTIEAEEQELARQMARQRWGR
jgi:hypothetical protein